MLRKFECKNCHTRFEADDQSMVVCPQCQSDNVDYAHGRGVKGAWKWVAAIAVVTVIAAAVVTTIKQCRGNASSQLPTKEPVPCDTCETLKVDSVDPLDSDIVIPDEITEPPTIESGSLRYEDGGYTFSVAIHHKPTRPCYVAVMEYRGTKEIARSTDGTTFRNVPPADDDEGRYDLTLFDSETGQELCSIMRSGFTRPVAQQMTAGQLQAMIDADDEALYGIIPQVAADCKLHFTGLPDDAQKPETLADVMEKIGRMWQSVKVTKVSHDAENRINNITIEVKIAE